jgi:hypothetical protein
VSLEGFRNPMKIIIVRKGAFSWLSALNIMQYIQVKGMGVFETGFSDPCNSLTHVLPYIIIPSIDIYIGMPLCDLFHNLFGQNLMSF